MAAPGRDPPGACGPGCFATPRLLAMFGIYFLEPLLLARLASDVDADVTRPQSQRLHEGRKPGDDATRRAAERILARRIESFFNHSQGSECS